MSSEGNKEPTVTMPIAEFLDRQVESGNLTVAECIKALVELSSRNDMDRMHPVFDSLAKRLDRAEAEKKAPWRIEKLKYNEMNEAAMKFSNDPDTRKALREAFEQRVMNQTAMDPQMVFIINYLLYFEGDHGDLYLAHLLMNHDEEDRLQMHNWLIQGIANPLIQERMGKSIKHLKFPLFPAARLQDLNVSVCEEAVKSTKLDVEGGGPQWEVSEQSATKKAYKTGRNVTPIYGGGPQTTVPVYAPGNPEAVAMADVTVIQDAYNLQSQRIAALEKLVKSQKTHIAKLQRKQQVDGAPAPNARNAANAGFPNPDYGRGYNRNGNRDGNGGRRGNNAYRGNYRGGEADIDELFSPSHGEAKNQ